MNTTGAGMDFFPDFPFHAFDSFVLNSPEVRQTISNHPTELFFGGTLEYEIYSK